jgi:uncharacterized delta-60 repeat protein
MFANTLFKGHRKSLSFVCAVALVALLCASLLPGLRRAGAQTTDPIDRTFGNNGVATFPANPTYTGGQAFLATVVRPDGKIVSIGVAQRTSGNFSYALVAARHNANGSLDTTFGTNGLFTDTAFNSPGSSFNGIDAVLQPDNKIIVVAPTSNALAYIVRLNPDGGLDASFNNGGFIKFVGDAAFFGAAVQPDGKILAAGVQFSSGTSVPVLARFNPDGSVDTSFDTDGRVHAPFVTNAGFTEIAVLPDGGILVAGEFTPSGGTFERGYIVMRLNADGSPDTAFDTDGALVIPIVQNRSANALRTGLAVQPDGKFVLAYGYNGYQNLFTARFNADGSPDTNFGTGGTIEDTGTQPSAVSLLPDGRILVIGTSKIILYLANGTPDPAFGTGGTISNAGGDDGFIQPDGKIVALRTINTLVRYLGTFSATATPTPTPTATPTPTPSPTPTSTPTPTPTATPSPLPTPPDCPALTNDQLDATFDGNGVAHASTANTGEQLFDVAVQPDGKIVAVGQETFLNANGGLDVHSLVMRFNADGSLDNDFGAGGRAIIDFNVATGSRLEGLAAVALQPDGRIVVAGGAALTHFIVARLNQNGSLDETFDGDGRVATRFNANSFGGAQSLDLEPGTGRIVVGGGVTPTPSEAFRTDFGIARYNTDGSPDQTFDGDGKAVTRIGSTDAFLNDLAVQPDGRIVTAGRARTESPDRADPVVVRFTVAGALDTTFDGDGIFSTSFIQASISNNASAAQGLALQPDGRIVVVADRASDTQAGLFRLNSDGSPDTTFGTGGGRATATRYANNTFADVSLQPDGKIIVAGVGETCPSGFCIYVGRYTANGFLDTTFSCDGFTTTNTDVSQLNSVRSVVATADGRIVAAGHSTYYGLNNSSDTDFLIARYLSGGAQATPTPTPTPSPTPSPTPATNEAQFAAANYSVAEGLERTAQAASLNVTVTRTGDLSGTASVRYRALELPGNVRCDVANGTAYERCDYARARGTLRFNAGESAKIISVSITDDSHVEGDETFQLILENPLGVELGSRALSLITITDNDTTPGANSIDNPAFFARQHYLDFLGRAPEQEGFNAWLAVLNNCGAGSGDRGRDPACDRLIVSTSFFWSDEFMRFKGYYVYRFYEAALGRRPTYQEFVLDLQNMTGETGAETIARQAAYAVEFTERQEFRTAYDALSSADYVNAIFATAEIAERASITRLDGTTLTRAQLADGSRPRPVVLREVVESREVAARFFNRAFVAAGYFGYLRREPEEPGYSRWVTLMDADPLNFRTIVNGFVNSVEYRLRFGQP